jgi:predicted RecA/RadA family phage recombinase
MSELTKVQLKSDNNSSFPDNNTGYITPTILRDFNTNVIDSLVDEISYNVESASFNTRITALTSSYSSSIQISELGYATTSSVSQSVSSLNSATSSYITNSQTASMSVLSSSYALTASYAMNGGGAVTTGSLLLTASAAGNTITFTKGDGSTFPVTVSGGAQGDFVTTSSFNSYTASASTNTSASINAATQSLSSSIATTDLAQSSSIASLQSWSSSLDSTYATDAQLSASASTLQNDINTRLLTSSFNSYTASASTNVSASINAATQSLSSSLTLTDNSKLNSASFNLFTASALLTSSGWASTGSNTFIGNQIISGNLDIAGNISAVSASFLYVKTVYETASVIYSSGSNQLGDELSDVQTLSGSVKVQGGLTVNGINVILVGQTASYASASISSSYAINAQSSSGFAVSNYIDFNTSSAEPTWKSGRVFWDNTNGTLGVYNSEADITLQVGQENWTRVFNNTGVTISNGAPVKISGTQGDTPRIVLAQSIAMSGSINTPSQILGVATHDIETGTYGYVTTQGVVRGLNTNAFADGDTLYVSTSAGVLTNVLPVTPYESIIVGQCVKASPGASGLIYVAVQQPIDFSDLSSVSIYGSYENGDMWYYSGSGATGGWYHKTITEIGLVTTSSFNSYTSSASTNTSASINSATSSLSSSLSASIGALSASIAATDAGQLSTASFNAFTASVITTGSSAATQNITGSLIISGATFNAKVFESTLSVGTTTLDTLFESTQSGVVSEIDITRLGAGPTGDLTGVRLQTLSGSATAGDTLLSSVTTGVNRHTTTLMTGSVVNTTITSTWATGSAGTRVAYSSNVIANAQSQSATLTLSAGNGANNFAGGTASLSAGRVNIGTTSGIITSTGSFTHNGTFVTSNGITSNQGGITATSGSINGEFRVNGSINITGSNPTILSGSLSGSLVSSLGDIYPSTPQGNFIVTIDSASMATLIAGASTNANTLYFVI